MTTVTRAAMAVTCAITVAGISGCDALSGLLTERGPAGGVVFYDKGEFTDGWRYLEAAPSDIEIDGEYNHVWGGNHDSVAGTSLEIGSGQANTAAIVAEYGESEPAGGTSEYAARLCDTYEHGGYDDWFLPSIRELHEMYLDRESIGGFEPETYWSSSQEQPHTAMIYAFAGMAGPYSNLKTNPVRVRAIRAY